MTGLLLLAEPQSGRAQFTFTTNSGAITITGYTGSGGDVVIPSVTNDYPVRAIGTNAFSFNTAVTNVTIPDSVIRIGYSAFGFCSGLRRVTIGNSVTSIDYGAFAGCPGLTSATIPDGVTSIGELAFGWCSGLASVAIPDSVTRIGDSAFEQCALTSVTIGSGVTDIGTRAFGHCASLHQAFFKGNAPSVNGGAGSGDSTVFNGESGTVYYLPGTTGWGATFGGWPTAGWPLPEILRSGLGVQSNGFGFTISCAVDISVEVFASTDLRDLTLIGSNTLVNGTSAFVDSAWTNHPQRFYRVRSP